MGLFVYILKCSDNSYYVGVTNNPGSGIVIHNQESNTDSFTYKRRPVVMVWSDFLHSNLEAIAWEKKLKGSTRKKKEALIKEEFNVLHELAVCQNGSHSDYYHKGASTPINVTQDGTSTSVNVSKYIGRCF